jgi:hypothetical protein
MPKKPATSKIPPYLEIATSLYGDSLGARRANELLEAMQTWSELPEDEQRFVIAHLSYLGVQGQAANQRVLTQIRDLLDEIAEQMSIGLDSTLPRDDEPGSELPQDAPMPPTDASQPAVIDAIVVPPGSQEGAA